MVLQILGLIQLVIEIKIIQILDIIVNKKIAVKGQLKIMVLVIITEQMLEVLWEV